jgi:hypothetical protein
LTTGGRREGFGGGDLYVSFRLDDGELFGPVFGERHRGTPAARSTEHLQEAILAGPDFAGAGMSVDSMRAAFASGRYEGLAEFMPQYRGVEPTDPSILPFFALAEELDVPVGIHMGIGPPGVVYQGNPSYRMNAGDPVLLEDVLVRHPRLRLWVMHAAWPRTEAMIALMHAHPQVHVDIGVLSEDQKRDIMCRDAARFLRLDLEICG